MRVFYNSTNTNFGDHLNSWIWNRLAPGLFETEDDRVLVGIGSLLKADLSRVPGKKIILGSGSGYGRPVGAEVSKDWSVYAVRGPLTASLFGIPSAKAITDGAWLVDKLPEFQFRRDRGDNTIFIPHWTTAKIGDWEHVCRMAGLEYVNPLEDFHSILDRISRAKLVISESLHGAIFADYYRTPWIPVYSSQRFLHFKWIDWCRSLGLEYRPVQLPPSDFIDFILQGRRPRKDIHDQPVISSNFGTDIGAPVVEPRTSNTYYRIKQGAKRRARVLKESSISALCGGRGLWPVKTWNSGYQDELVSYIDKVKSSQGYLSTDKIRVLRLDQLNSAFDAFLREQT